MSPYYFANLIKLLKDLLLLIRITFLCFPNPPLLPFSKGRDSRIVRRLYRFIDPLTHRPIDLLRRLISYVLCLAFFFILCSSPVHAAPPLWTQSRQISLGSAFSSEADACSRGDEVYVVWSDDRTGNKEIFLAASSNAGQRWSSEERLTDTPGESTQPAIACDRKNLYVVWRERTAGRDARAPDASQIHYKRWDGRVWSNDLLLSDGYDDSKRPEMASTTLFPGSYLYVVWDSDEDDRITSYLIRSTDGGRSFSEPQPVTAGDWSTREPAIWGGARDVYIAWADNREGGWNIFFKRWGEVQPGPDMKLSTLPDCHSPAVGGAEPGVYVAWQHVERRGGVKPLPYADIYFSFSMNYGVTWAGAESLTDGEAESVFPKISVLDVEGRSRRPVPWIFWQDGRNGEWQLFFWMLDTRDQVLGVQHLTDIDKPTVLLDIVSTPGQIHAFWTRLESKSQANIMYMRRDTVAPERPGAPSHFDLTALPGYDDDDQITFLWEASESKGIMQYDIYLEESRYEDLPLRADNRNFLLTGSTESTSYSVSGESGKVYRVYVEAVDEVGNVSVSSETSSEVICDPDPPEVMLHSPRSDSTIRGAIPIIASVHDLSLLEYSVEYGITAAPSVWWQLAGPFYEESDRQRIMTWETSDLNGIYTLRILARDDAGNESKVQAMVNIDSRSPIAMSPGEITPLTDPDLGWTYGAPAWSPGGGKIAFHSDEGGTEDIWVMSPVGTGLEPAYTRLTRNTAIEHNPAWSPSGDMIAFQSFTEEGLWDIWVMRVEHAASLLRDDGGNAKQITSEASSDANPVWSPDGSSIAFDSDRDGDNEIFLITNVQQVLTGAEPQFVQLTDNHWEDKHPTWSPDGSKIIFQSSRRGNWDLFEIGIDGTNLNIIVATSADEIEPDWSPDRKRVLFSTNEPGDHYEIRAINWPEKSEYVHLSPKGEDARYAHWSPAMDSIAYEHEGSLYSAALVYPIGQLEAIISWPRGGEVLTGKVDVEGIARGRNFRAYSLQYSACVEHAASLLSDNLADHPYDFRLIGGESTSPVLETGFLGRWYTEELEGEYLLKLAVIGEDGSYIEDSVRVLIANQLPFILIDEPRNGQITNQQIITVKGHAGQRVTITLNDSEIYLNPDGSFSRKIQLSEGPNTIIMKARSPSSQNGEHVVERTVVLDTQPPGIMLESPEDFQVVHVPYVTVKGQVDERAEVSILSTRVWPDENGHFQRRISCSEGVNLILVVASDELGHYGSVLRRVIFQRETEIMSDIFAPAVTDVFPDNHAVVTGRNVLISATLVDDVGLDPLSITFSSDDEEVTSEEYDLDIEMPDATEDFPLDQYPIIHFTYRLIPPVDEGDHSFKIGVEDTSGNLGQSTFNFSVDTAPSQAIVSAHLTSTGQIRVVAVANKRLAQISRGAVYNAFAGTQHAMQLQGYSLSSFVQVEHAASLSKDGYYEAFLDISPSQRSFIIDFAARTYLGGEVSAHGYIAWDEVRPGKRVNLGIESGPRFSSDPVNDGISDLIIVLRSQDGLDADLLTIQQNDAEYRRLRPLGLVYVLSASEELVEHAASLLKVGEMSGILSLPILRVEHAASLLNAESSTLDADIQRLVMFHWDEELKQWQPLDRIGLTEEAGLESQISGPGIYALFADVEPPVIKDVSPMDAGEVPLDRFFVEASVSDRGSGISASQIRIMVDGKQADHKYNPVEGRLTYFPSSLEWGLHSIEIIAMDRAGNVAEFSTSFVTKESFQFITIQVYPNPASSNVSIEFKLNRLANVTLRIYTIAGQLVYKHDMGKTADGKFVWKCENNAGNRIASGIYIYSMEALLYETKIYEQGAIAVVM